MAEKLNVRPPLLTLVTRFTATKRSTNSIPVGFTLRALCIVFAILEFQAAFTSAFCQLFNTTMVEVTTAIETNFSYTIIHCKFG